MWEPENGRQKFWVDRDSRFFDSKHSEFYILYSGFLFNFEL